MVKTNFGKKGKKENKKNGLTQLGQPYRTGPTQRENQPARPNRLSLSLLSLISGTHQSAGPTRQRRPLPLDVLNPDSSQTLTLTGSGSILAVRAPRRPHPAPKYPRPPPSFPPNRSLSRVANLRQLLAGSNHAAATSGHLSRLP
jgi:hypothetical protein